jgi:hypothetical protein
MILLNIVWQDRNLEMIDLQYQILNVLLANLVFREEDIYISASQA